MNNAMYIIIRIELFKFKFKFNMKYLTAKLNFISVIYLYFCKFIFKL